LKIENGKLKIKCNVRIFHHRKLLESERAWRREERGLESGKAWRVEKGEGRKCDYYKI